MDSKANDQALSRRQWMQGAISAPALGLTGASDSAAQDANAAANAQVRPATTDSLEFLAAPWQLRKDWGLPADFAARWIWHDVPRTPAGAFYFFRREFDLEDFRLAECWVSGNGRYQLFVNGKFVQRGPAPCDPRRWEVDWVDLAPLLQRGRNVVAAVAVNYGNGEGTYVPSTPLGEGTCAGFLFEARIETPSGEFQLVTDASWRSRRAASWKPQPKRWYLKALSEVFDAREWPMGWLDVGFDETGWKAARVLSVPPGRPIASPPGGEWPDDWRLVARKIAPMREARLLAMPARGTGALGVGALATWTHPLEDDCVLADPEAIRIVPSAIPAAGLEGTSVSFPIPHAIASTNSSTGGDLLEFTLERIVCGHPFVRVDAPAGTVVDLVWSETRSPRGPFHNPAGFLNWAQFTCRDGVNEFSVWEWEALRHLTVMLRAPQGTAVTVLEAGVIERSYPYAKTPLLRTSDEIVNRVIAATLQTHRVTCQDVIVDNVTRERQQYAGDIDHAKLTSYYAFGDIAQARRMLETYQLGQNDEGWFLDCWPAWDRTQRLWQKHLGLTNWGPILDHGVEFVISAAKYALFSGDLETARSVYQRGLRFGDFLWAHREANGLVPSDGWRWNSVWIDHDGYRDQNDKLAAWNCYLVGFFDEGIARMADWFGDSQVAAEARRRAGAMRETIRKQFWDPTRQLIVDDLPTLKAFDKPHVHERTLAMALLYRVIAATESANAVRVLASFPTDRNEKYMQPGGFDFQVGFGFPPNHCWRYWALAKFGRGDTVVKELRERWGRLPSLNEAGTFGETWEPSRANPRAIWCQNGSPPVYALFGDVLGVRPTSAGWVEFQVRPQPGDLATIAATIPTARGALPVQVRRIPEGPFMGGNELRITPLPNTRWRLLLPEMSAVDGLPEKATSVPVQSGEGCARWDLPGNGRELRVRWKPME